MPACLAADLWQQHPHVVLDQCLPCDGQGNLRLDRPIELNRQRLDALLVGPGIGPGIGPAAESQEGAFWRNLLAWPGLVVLDADGLNRLSGPAILGWASMPALGCSSARGPPGSRPTPANSAGCFPSSAATQPLFASALLAKRPGPVAPVCC